jgi:hypothetical protein
MATALDLIKASFSILGIHEAETPIESSEANEALEIFNDLGVEWELTGANIGFAPVNDLADEVRIPRGAYSAFKYNVAARLAPIYEIVLSAENISIANNSLRTMMTIYRKPLKIIYPGTLPMGEANGCDNYLIEDNFYPDVEKENF